MRSQAAMTNNQFSVKVTKSIPTPNVFVKFSNFNLQTKRDLTNFSRCTFQLPVDSFYLVNRHTFRFAAFEVDIYHYIYFTIGLLAITMFVFEQQKHQSYDQVEMLIFQIFQFFKSTDKLLKTKTLHKGPSSQDIVLKKR